MSVPPRAFLQLVKVEARLEVREPVGPILGIGLPVVLFIILANIPGIRQPISPGSSVTYLFNYVPILIGTSLTLIALFSVPIPLVGNRERGWLRRLSTTPVGPAWLLAAEVAVNLVMALVAIAIIVLGSHLFLGVQLPAQPAGFVLSVVLASAALLAIGFLIAAVAPTARWAQVMGGVLLYPSLFFGGMWYPVQDMPALLRAIAGFTPLAAAGQAMLDAMQGSFPSLRALAVLAACAVIFGAAAVRFFRWE